MPACLNIQALRTDCNQIKAISEGSLVLNLRIYQILGLLFFLLVAGCSLLPTSRTQQISNEAPTPTPIPTSPVPAKPTYKVQSGEVIKQMQFSGRISPVEEKDLFFRTNGRVRTVYFKRNDTVKKGDVIADLEIEGLERDLQSTDLELERAQVTLNEAEKSLEFDRRASQLQLEMAQLRLDNLIQSNADNTSISLAQKELELAQISIDKLAGDVSILLKNDLTRAQYNVEKLKQQIDEARIIAPFDGLLLSMSLTPGQGIEGYKPQATLANVSNLEVTADLFSDQLKDLAEEMVVSVALSSRPSDALSGTVRLLPYPYGKGGSGKTLEEQDKSTRITVNQSPIEAGFALGDLVRVTVELERKESVLWVPPQALRLFNGRRFAVVQDGEVQRRVDVTIGIETEERIEIKEGLEEGQTVVGQ